MYHKLIITLLLFCSISFGQSGKAVLTDAQKNSIISLIQDSLGYVTPEKYGAVGDGITDDYTAFSNMVDGANEGSIINLKTGATYKISGSSQLVIDKTLYINGNGATIDLSDHTLNQSYSIIQVGKYLDIVSYTYFDIPVEYDSGAYKLKVDSDISNNVSRGDLLFITMATRYGGNNTAWYHYPTIYKGEICEVLSVSNDTVTIVSGLEDTYPISGTKMAIMQPVSGYMKDLNIISTINASRQKIGLRLAVVKDYTLDNVRIDGFEYQSADVRWSYNVNVNNYRSKDFYRSGLGTNYGLGVTSSQNITIQNSFIFGGRHALDVSANFFPSRRVLISNNILDNNQNANSLVFSTHPGSEKVTIMGNDIRGSMTIRSSNFRILNNTISRSYYSTQPIVQISGFASPSGYAIINGNRLYEYDGGIALYISLSTGDWDLIDIENNYIESELPLRLAKSPTGATITDLIIKNNVMKSRNLYGLWLGNDADDTSYVTNLDISGNSFSGASSVFTYLIGLDVNQFSYRNNKYFGDNAVLVSDATTYSANYEGNYVDKVGSSNYPTYRLTTDNTSVLRFENNTIKDFTVQDTILSIKADDIYYGGTILDNANVGATELYYQGTVHYLDGQDKLSITQYTDSVRNFKTDSYLFPFDIDKPTPMKLINQTVTIDSVNAMVYSGSTDWQIKIGNDWASLTDTLTTTNTTNTTTPTNYTSFGEKILLKNNRLFLDASDTVACEIFYTKENFYPSDLEPEFWLRHSTYDANNKVTEWKNFVNTTYLFGQSDTSKNPTKSGDTLVFATDDYLVISDASALNLDFGTNDITIEGWIKSTGSGFQEILSDYGAGNDRWTCGLNNDKMSFTLVTSEGTSQLNSTGGATSFTDGNWHHFAVVLDRNIGVYIYGDGGLEASELTSEWTVQDGHNVSASTNPTIGSSAVLTSYFNGSMYGLRFYTQALTSTQILQLYNFGRK